MKSFVNIVLEAFLWCSYVLYIIFLENILSEGLVGIFANLEEKCAANFKKVFKFLSTYFRHWNIIVIQIKVNITI